MKILTLLIFMSGCKETAKPNKNTNEEKVMENISIDKETLSTINKCANELNYIIGTIANRMEANNKNLD